jgi:hypothetical protein
MVTVIAWKEWRQQIALVVAILALAGIGIAASAHYLPQEWEQRAANSGAMWLILLVALAIAQGIVTGAMLFAGENEDGTQDFLDQHAALRAPVWRAKMLVGASLVGCSAVGLGAMLIAFDISGLLGLGACLWFGLNALAWAAACSVRRKTTFGAIGVAVPVIFVVTGTTFGMAMTNRDSIAYLVFLALEVPLLLVALATSWWLYCSADLRRIRSAASPMASPHWFARRFALPTWLTVTLWHLWARRKGTLALLAIGPFAIAYYTVRSAPLLAWPIGTFLLGCVAGWAVFADEQSTGAERFLGDQRLPRGRLWLAKTLPLFALALLGGSLALAVSVASHGASNLNPALLFPWWIIASGNGNGVLALSYALSFVVLGFGFAQFATQQTRKMPVAIFLTLGLGAPVAALWYPSLYNGLPAWRVWLIPVLFSAASLAQMPRWLSGRLHDRGGIARLAALFAVAAFWLGGNLWWRDARFSDPGEPFDLNAYWTKLIETPDPHGAELREAALALEERLKEADTRFPNLVNPTPKNRNDAPLRQWRDFNDEVLRDGVVKDPGECIAYLDFVLAGAWADPFKKAALAPPDRLLPIGDLLSQDRDLKYTPFVFEGADLFLIRFVVRVRSGETAAALDDFEVALAAIRHAVHGGNSGLSANRNALAIGASTIDLAVHDAAFRTRFMQILAHHEVAWPDFTEIVKSNYYFTRTSRTIQFQGSAENVEVNRALVEAPWERGRVESLRKRAYAAFLADAQAGRFPLRDGDAELFAEYFGRPPVIGRTVEPYFWNMAHLYQTQTGTDLIFFLQRRLEYAHSLVEVRGLRLVLAALDYEAEKGEPISSMSDLVPRYFKQLPQSPFVGKSFDVKIYGAPEEVWVDRGVPKSVPTRVVFFETATNQNFVVPMMGKK